MAAGRAEKGSPPLFQAADQFGELTAPVAGNHDRAALRRRLQLLAVPRDDGRSGDDEIIAKSRRAFPEIVFAA
jgi:hypothetical protein